MLLSSAADSWDAKEPGCKRQRKAPNPRARDATCRHAHVSRMPTVRHRRQGAVPLRTALVFVTYRTAAPTGPNNAASARVSQAVAAIPI